MSAAPSSRLAAFSRRSNRIEVFWVGTDGTLWTNAWIDGTDVLWNRLQPISPNGGVRPGSPISVTARSAYGLDVFWLGVDGAVWTVTYDERLDGGVWSAPFPITPHGTG